MNARLPLLTAMFGCLSIASNAESQVSSTIIPTVFSVENSGASYAKPAKLTSDQMESYAMLPDPFAWSDGSGRSENYADWEKRRNEIKSEVEYYEIGEKPEVDREQVDAEFENGLLTVTVKVGENITTLTSNLSIPSGDGPHPVFIAMGMSSLSSLFNGCISMTFSHDQVATYGSDSKRYPNDPFNVLYPELYDNGNYSKWAWGVSRLIDGLEIAKEKGQLNVDLEHIALSGCSYAGKMAMFAGAYDERVALTVVQESGGGGASAWRTIDYTSKQIKKSVEGIGNTNYSWFMTSMQQFSGKQDILPHDHHEILAMCAPRALLVLGNTDMEWLGDFSTYITCRAAEKIYETFGIEDRFGFVIDGGHGHCSATSAENEAVKAFAQKFIFGDTTVNTMIRTITDGSNYAKMDTVNYERWYEGWKPANPNQPKAKISEPAASVTYSADEIPSALKVKVDVEDINNDIEKVEFFVNGRKIRTVNTEPYEYNLTGFEPGVFNVYAIATDSTGLYKKTNTITITVLTPIVAVKKAETAPVIDGKAEDIWNDAEKLYANNILTGTGGNGSSNCSGYVQLLWDENYIYALCNVTDNQLVNDGGDVYENDNVELYFDCNNSKGGSYDSDDVQLSFNYDSPNHIETIPTTYKTNGINYVVAPNPTGYIVEASIPWTTIKGKIKSGMEIGFEFMINDDDDGSSRDNKIAWNSTSDNAWQSASSFGTITIEGEVDPSKIIDGIGDIVFSGIGIYPNPAENLLNIYGIDGDFDYEIFNIAGNIVLTGKANKNINIDALPKGMYNIRINTKDGFQNLKFVKR